MQTPDNKLMSETETTWERFKEVAESITLTAEQEQILRALFAVSPFIGRVAESYPEHLLTDFLTTVERVFVWFMLTATVTV